MLPKIVCGVLLFLIVTSAGTGASLVEPERLPPNIVPIHYDLALVPDAAHLTFHGQVRIAIDVRASTPAVVLNSDGLVLDKAVLDGKEPGAIAIDTKLQRATMTFAHGVAIGRHTLAIDYHGVIGIATLGFFAMDYASSGG